MEETSDEFTPRDYQVALREIAIDKNSIIYLPTGTGKTFIAVLVLKQLQRCRIKYTEGGTISFVVVNTIALVDQHAKCIKNRTTLEVKTYTGDMNLDFWPKDKWVEELDNGQVFVMTIQILVNLTNQGFLDLNKVNLIVFDECHRGVSDQPMRQLCKSLGTIPNQPRILGLTATLLNGNCKPGRVLAEVEKLETTYHSQVATVDGLERVTGFSTNPREVLVVFNSHTPNDLEIFTINRLKSVAFIFQRTKDVRAPHIDAMPHADLKPLLKEEGFKKIVNTLLDVAIHIETLGIYGGLKSIRAHIIQIERIRKHCDDATLFDGLNYVQTILTYLYRMFEKAMHNYTEEQKIYLFSSEKVKELIKIFETYGTQSQEELCAIVFTKRRFTAKVLYYILDSLSQASEKFSHIKADFMVGYNANPYNNTREVLYNSKKNKEILQSFDNKEINVMCSSNVLEEGVDIPTCSLVVKFDHPEEYRSYIQSKGRARNKSSLFYMLVEKSYNEKFYSRYVEFQQIENKLNQLLVGKNMLRDEPSQYAIEQMYNEDQFPPYYAGEMKLAKVDMTSAISLLCQYCSSLPCDKYTSLAPALYYKEKQNLSGGWLTSVTIVLPTISPLRDPIEGPFTVGMKSAKRAAALKACELLHKMGELDDHLLPKKCKIADEDVNFLFGHYPEVKEEMAGTNRNKRKHQKEIPTCLRGPLKANTPVWLHIMDLQPTFQRREEVNYATFYDIYISNLCYGFITPNPVPAVCDFSIYISMGAMNVSLERNVTSFSFTEEDLLDIKEFNYIIYNDILTGLQRFLISDDGNNAESMLLVPLNKQSKTIDFDVLRAKKNVVTNSKQLTTEERLQLNVTQEGYLGKVVTPWYRDIGNFLVTEVSLNKSAKSEFPNEQYATYEEYYKDKHNVGILNPNQPLLYVKRLSQRINFTKPFGVQNKRKREKVYEELDIYLIPELVVKHDFHATLWIQAHLLPTLISRYSFLFRLEEFRSKMAKEMNIGEDQQELKQPLELDAYLLDYEADIETPKTTVNVLVSEPKEDVVVPSPQMNVNKDYMKKMLEREYPWKASEEPKDIERDLNVTLFDIDCYEAFMCKTVGQSDMSLKNVLTNTQREHLALTYFKDYQEKPIDLIKEKERLVGPELCLIYKAMTTAEANDVVNMERLETLGDSFLKLFGSLYVFLRFPQFTEGLATTLKSRLVSNKNLYYLAMQKNIGGIMKVNDFQKNDWLSPGFKVPDKLESRIEKKETSLASLFQLSIPREEQVSGKLSKATINAIMEVQSEEDLSEDGLMQLVAPSFKCNYIGDKKIADCVEALLGAYFQTCGVTGGIKFIEWIGIIPKSENLMELLKAEPPNPVVNDRSSIQDIDYHIPDWEIIENDILGYHFKNRGYLLQALTHASYSANRVTQSYEKLEFVGDAILDFLITCHIFESCGNLSPGALTDLRSALVNNITFANLVVRHNLHKYLLMINIKLQTMIDRFAGYLDSKQLKMDEEVLILLEEDEAGMKLADYVDVPKVLGDIFEALAGAIYLDSGKDLEVTWKVFHRLMWKEIDAFSANVPINLVRKLYEWSPDPHPKFGSSVVATAGKVVVPLQFMLHGRKQQVYGFGSNKLMAKKAAAKLALRQLQS